MMTTSSNMISMTINGTDAWTAWGVYLTPDSLGSLLAPPPMKERITSTSRLENGVRTITDDAPRVDQRDFTFQIGIYGATESDFISHVSSFCSMLTESKEINITVLGQTYHCIYISCSQFSQWLRGVGKFSLKLREFNPANRS